MNEKKEMISFVLLAGLGTNQRPTNNEVLNKSGVAKGKMVLDFN
jgi:hypothetical protein